jgi:hypothetical protein
MIFHYTPDMMPISNTILPSKKANVILKASSGINHCRISDEFIYYAVRESLSSRKRFSLSNDYELVTLKTRKYAYYYDIIVINKQTNDIVILLQNNKIFLFDCPDEIWLLFQAILEATTDSSYVYTILSREYVEETRFSLQKLEYKEIGAYIVQTLINDGVLKVS